MFVWLVFGSVNAATINTISSDATAHEFISSGFTNGPIVESGITYTSTTSRSVYGYNGGYGFSGNGGWSNMDMLGLNTQLGIMTIEFDTEVSEVLAFVNYIDSWAGNARMSIFDINFNLLETNDLNFSVSGNNAGFDLGFKRNTDEIKYLQFIDQGVGAANLRSYIGTSEQIPEPSNLVLIGLGLFAMLGVSPRRS